jgi:hypothetical protein
MTTLENVLRTGKCVKQRTLRNRLSCDSCTNLFCNYKDQSFIDIIIIISSSSSSSIYLLEFSSLNS